MSSTAKFAPGLGGRFWRLQSQVSKSFSSVSSSMSHIPTGTGSQSSTQSSSFGKPTFGSSPNFSFGSSSQSTHPSGFSSFASKK